MKLLIENWRKFVKEEESKLDKGALYQLGEPSTPLATYVAILKKYANDPNFDKIAAAGQADGDAANEKVTVTPATVTARSLTATQSEIGSAQSLGDQVINKYDATKTALGLNGTPIAMSSKSGPSPLLVFNGKFILDGHHRWSQVMMVNPDGKVLIDNVTGPELDNEEEALKAMQFAIAATADQVVTKPFEGIDLMSSSEQEVYQFVMENVSDEVLQLLVMAKKIQKPSKELAAKYIAGNLPIIMQSKGRFSREKSMPQAGDSGVSQDAVNKALGTGKVNFIKPSPKDASKYLKQPNVARKAKNK
jgi:hypothetical protein